MGSMMVWLRGFGSQIMIDKKMLDLKWIAALVMVVDILFFIPSRLLSRDCIKKRLKRTARPAAAGNAQKTLKLQQIFFWRKSCAFFECPIESRFGIKATIISNSE